MNKTELLYHKAQQWLIGLIAIPSFSREEEGTARFLAEVLASEGVAWESLQHNIYACNRFYDPNKPSLLLNSHHDTVRPNKGYTKDPFQPLIKEGKLYGLGSNDAGASLVSLMAAFIHFYHREDLPFNLWFAASAEEEISGRGGVELLLPVLGKLDCAIVGEPTQMQMAVAERGLLVVDCVAEGVAGHAARGEGINALYVALEDIERLRNYQFDKESTLLGSNQVTVTVIETSNHQHNVVPADCRFVLDIRLNEKTSFEEMLLILSTQLKSRFTPRSLRMRPSSIDVAHPLVQTGMMLGKKTYGSPTTSDVALLPVPALKMGPGDSARSHTADEYIYLEELRNGVEGMIHFLELFMKNVSAQSNQTTLKGI